MKKLNIYGCAYCGFSGSRKEVAEHEKECKFVDIVKAREKEEKAKQLEAAHSTHLLATSPSHYCELLQEYAKKYNNEDVKIAITNITYGEHTSNTHYCPIGGCTNWDRVVNKPTGYPALNGTISLYRAKENNNSIFLSCRSTIPGFVTGSGGYRSCELGVRYEYTVIMWLSDFPLIEKQVKLATEIDILSKQFDKEELRKQQLLSGKKMSFTGSDAEWIALQKAKTDLQKRLEERNQEINHICNEANKELLPLSNPYTTKASAVWNIILTGASRVNA